MRTANRRASAAAAAAVLIVGLIELSTYRWGNVDWLRVGYRASFTGYYMDGYVLPFFIVAGTLIGRMRRAKVAVFLAVVGVVLGTSVAVFEALSTSYSIKAPALYLRLLAQPENALACMALSVLLVQRLRGRLDLLRPAAAVLYVTVIGAHLLTYAGIPWLATVPVYAIRTVLAAGAFGAMSFAAWCLAFRQAAPNRPPVDTKRVVALACPRCGLRQEIRVGHGRCAGCCLDISISLNEGVCGACGYALRGLTGEKCPECGTRIFVAPASGYKPVS